MPKGHGFIALAVLLLYLLPLGCGGGDDASTPVIITPPASNWTVLTLDTTGDTGRSPSMAIAPDGSVHISYYDATNRDLRYANNKSGFWLAITIDSPGDVGLYSSLAIDASGYVHISYFDNTSGDLKYATNSYGYWLTSTLESAGIVGQYTSLALDASGKAHISYKDQTNSLIKYATNATGAWVMNTVDTGSLYTTSLALDSSGRPYIAYYEVYLGLSGNTGSARYASKASGAWVVNTLTPAGTVGFQPVLALDSGGNAHMAYHQTWKNASALADLVYVTNATGAWITGSIDNSSADSGYGKSLKLDSSGKAHISFYDYTNADLKYATNITGSWAVSTVESSGDVGLETSLALDSSGKAHICFYDSTSGDLRYARQL